LRTTRPSPIQLSASRREQSPARAMTLAMRAPDSSASTRTVWVELGRRSGALPGAGLRLNTGGGEAARASANCGFAGLGPRGFLACSGRLRAPLGNRAAARRRGCSLPGCSRINSDSRLSSKKGIKHSIRTISSYGHDRFGGRPIQARSRCFPKTDCRFLSAKP
jgi:hypothetical protein